MAYMDTWCEWRLEKLKEKKEISIGGVVEQPA
ncbi:hypothetical protein BH20BAC1_BH20BAC1_21920 [soil metagenome]